MKRTKLLAVGAAVVLCVSTMSTEASSAASSPWLKQFGTNRADGVGGVAVSSAGSVYVAGNTFGKFPGKVNAGQADAFLTRFSAAGTQSWLREFGTTGKEVVTGVAVSSSGWIYVVGTTDGTFPKQVNAGGTDGFLAKYSSGGTKQWVRQFGTAGNDQVRGVAVAPNGNVYIGGFTDGALPAYLNAGDTDAFLVKYSSGGTLKWGTQFGTVAHDELNGVAVTKTGIILVTGDTKGSLPLFVNAGDSDVFVAAFDANAVPLGHDQFGTASYDHGISITTAKTGEVYVGGYTGGSFPSFANAGGADAFLTQYDATFTPTWLFQFGTAADDDVHGVAITKQGNVVVGGSTYGSFPTFLNAGGSDGYAIVLDTTGIPLELTQFGTSANETVTGTAAAKSGDPIVAGGTFGSFPGFLNAGSSDAWAMDVPSELPDTL